MVSCDTTGLHKIISASAVDNCADDLVPTISISYDENPANDPCLSNNGTPNQTIVTVTYTATDACGNSGSASRDITVQRPDVSRVVLIEDDVALECTETVEEFSGIGVQRGYLNTTGDFVLCDTLGLSETDYICGYIASKEVEDIPGNDCGRKQFVRWSVLDLSLIHI